MKKITWPLFPIALLLAAFTLQDTRKPIDYLSVPGPLKFNNIVYNLAWSSKPNEHYIKQEYLATGDTLETYKKIILLEFLTNGLEAEDVVGTQSTMIEVRKRADSLAHYEVTKNPKTGEYLLNFTLSEGDDDAVNVFEWNVYRYKNIKDKSGKKGVLLFAVSMRGYGNKIKEFRASMKTNKTKIIALLNAYKLPEINLK